MKVIKKIDISNWSYKHTCSNCDSELEIEGKDLIGSENSDSYYTRCAVCSNIIYVKSENIPKLLRLEAKKKASKSSYGGGGGYFDR